MKIIFSNLVISFRESLRLWPLNEKKRWFRNLAWMETDKGKELRAGLVSALNILHKRGDVVEGIFSSLNNS